MRDLKFRAFYEGKMLHICEVEIYANVKFWSNSQVAYSEKDKSKMHIMQFTGLKDKNGKEIYEGDIVATYYSVNGVEQLDRIYKKAEVKWGLCDMPINGGEYAMWVVGPYVEDEYLYGLFCANNATIIGNIHETPNLL